MNTRPIKKRVETLEARSGGKMDCNEPHDSFHPVEQWLRTISVEKLLQDINKNGKRIHDR